MFLVRTFQRPPKVQVIELAGFSPIGDGQAGTEVVERAVASDEGAPVEKACAATNMSMAARRLPCFQEAAERPA